MIEKILKEIHRLKKELNEYSASEALDYIEAYINTLPEEHVSEDLEEEIKHYIQSEFPDGTGFPNVPKIARHFAKWQKQKDQETIELAEDHAMLAGMMKEREEMMKNAVDATILDVDAQTIEFGLWPEKLLDMKEGDKVKIIIIKEN